MKNSSGKNPNGLPTQTKRLTCPRSGLDSSAKPEAICINGLNSGGDAARFNACRRVDGIRKLLFWLVLT
ncbi:MAG: hypothetical protein AAGI63_00305 [Planctomycetota bacterium]